MKNTRLGVTRKVMSCDLFKGRILYSRCYGRCKLKEKVSVNEWICNTRRGEFKIKEFDLINMRIKI
jgi:hypothetical protein